MDTFADRLRWCLDQTGLTRRLLAAEAQLEVVTVFRLADGVRGKHPRTETVRALSDALGVPFGWLAFGDGTIPEVPALAERAAALALKHGGKLREAAEPESDSADLSDLELEAEVA